MAATFVAKAVELRGGFILPTPPDEAFEIFSPLGERLWVPGWNPELLHPAGVTWERGLIFRTQEELGEAVWVVTALDRERRQVEYHRIEPGRYVAKVNVACRADSGGQTAVRVVYAFVGLSEAGNREIEAMSVKSYEEKMRRWQVWLNEHLTHAALSGAPGAVEH